MQPFLRIHNPVGFEDLPEATVYESGYLVTKNAGWRSQRPVINLQKCIGCLQCYHYCPDGTIFKSDKKVAVDYDFCKGCGICEGICPKNAIVMEVEVK